MNTDQKNHLAHILISVVLAPSIILHELCHLIAAYPWVHSWSIDSWAPTRLTIRYRDDAPLLALAVATLAPTLVAIPLIPLVALYLPPLRPDEAFIVVCYLLAFAFPSAEDRRAFSYVRSLRSDNETPSST